MSTDRDENTGSRAANDRQARRRSSGDHLPETGDTAADRKHASRHDKRGDDSHGRLQLSPSQILASALAAVTATVAGSFLGVKGTVIGAALASVVTVLGNAIYGHSLRRTGERVKAAMPVAVNRARDPRSASSTRGTSAASASPGISRGRGDTRPISARKVALASIGLFVVLSALVTTVEGVTGRPLSDLVTGRHTAGTTLFGTHGASTSTGPVPTPTVTVTEHVVTVTPTVTQTAAPVTSTAPAPATTTTASAPASSSAPSTGAGAVASSSSTTSAPVP